MNKHYDLRSDTVTVPSEGMRKAMYDAEVGDDVYGEDPSVNRLQEKAAELTGKAAALFVPSGSMGNLIPIFLNCGRGNEIIAHKEAHILHYEMASLASVAGAMPVAAPGERGILHPAIVEPLVRPDIYYMPRTRMIEIENTHNRAGGSCWSVDETEAIAHLARKRGLSIHLDGARIMNASIALGVAPSKLCGSADTVTFCLSKGLGAPVGSVLCGSREFVAEARRVRKLLGGAMRQAGVLAAAGLYALENNVERLADDHEHAKRIARALDEVSWASLDPDSVETNIVYFETPGVAASRVVGKLEKLGIRCGATGPHTIRMVTNLAVSTDDVDEVCAIIRRA